MRRAALAVGLVATSTVLAACGATSAIVLARRNSTVTEEEFAGENGFELVAHRSVKATLEVEPLSTAPEIPPTPAC